MRAIWSGAVTFGLVNVPVRLYAATESHDVALHQVHDHDGGRIRYQRRCEVCGRVIQYDHIDRAYEEDGQTVVLTDDDLASLPEERSREIEVVEFVPSDQVDPILFEKSYYLEPDAKAVKAYALLRRTLSETDRSAVVQFSLRQKSRLGLLRVRDDVLVLQGLLWADELRDAAFPRLDEHPRVSAKELDMSMKLVAAYASDFEPEKFHDEYQEQLHELVEAKLEKGDALDTTETFGESDEQGGAEVLDLMEALKRSVDSSRSKRGGSSRASGQEPAAKKKKSTAAPQKKSAATAAAKKPAAKRSRAKSA